MAHRLTAGSGDPLRLGSRSRHQRVAEAEQAENPSQSQQCWPADRSATHRREDTPLSLSPSTPKLAGRAPAALHQRSRDRFQGLEAAAEAGHRLTVSF